MSYSTTLTPPLGTDPSRSPESSWTIAHRITGCQLKAIGLSEEEVALLNGFHETYEFSAHGILKH